MSAPASPRPLRADARRNRERVVEAARCAFGDCGDEAQVEDIARMAGVGVGTVYRHFPTKDALMGELIRAKFEAATALAREHLEVEDPWEAFAGFVRAHTEAMAADRAQQRMMWFATEEAWSVAEPALADLRGAAGALIRRAHRAKALRKDFGVDNMPTFMCALASAMQVDDRGDIHHDWRALRDFMLDGLRA